jgi:hypothetical protein
MVAAVPSSTLNMAQNGPEIRDGQAPSCRTIRGSGTVKLSDVWLGGRSKGGYPRRMTIL